MLTQERLKEILHYCPETGVFTWLKNGPNAIKPGCRAGWITAGGYVHIGIDKKHYRSHRLAFLYMDGAFPSDQVDHVDHNRINNKWANLRQVTRQENCRNISMTSKNTSGHTGVYWLSRDKKWEAKMGVSGKTLHLGKFTNIEDAISARAEANRIHGFHENHGEKL